MKIELSEKNVSRIPIRFTIESVGEAEGELIRHFAPRTVDTIAKRLPIEGRAALWKEEVYFETSIKMGEEKPKPKVEKGDIAFGQWETPSAFFTANHNHTTGLAS